MGQSEVNVLGGEQVDECRWLRCSEDGEYMCQNARLGNWGTMFECGLRPKLAVPSHNA